MRPCGTRLPVARSYDSFSLALRPDIIVSGAHCPGTQADRRIELNVQRRPTSSCKRRKLKRCCFALGSVGLSAPDYQCHQSPAGVVLRRRHVIQTLVHVGQLRISAGSSGSPLCACSSISRDVRYHRYPTRRNQALPGCCYFRFQFQRGAQITHRRRDIMTWR